MWHLMTDGKVRRIDIEISRLEIEGSGKDVTGSWVI